MDGNLLWQIAAFLIGSAAASGAVYGGIRADLRVMHQALRGHKKSIRRLHERLDGHGISGRKRKRERRGDDS